MKPFMQLFIAGWLCNSAFRSLQQDAIGRDKYVQLVQLGWISEWITVPVALLMLVLVWILVDNAKKEMTRSRSLAEAIVEHNRLYGIKQ